MQVIRTEIKQIRLNEVILQRDNAIQFTNTRNAHFLLL